MNPTITDPRPEAPAARRPLPARPERAAMLRALMGRPDPAVAHLCEGIRALARRSFARHVTPLVASHWPALRGQPFHDKLVIGACDLYASAPYTALFVAPRRPLPVRAVTDLGARLPLPLPTIALLGRGAMEVLGRFAYPDVHRRIILVSAFIVVVDHVFDHCLTEPPKERGRRLEAIIDGREPPTSPELRLMRALAVAMGDGLRGAKRDAFQAAMARMKEWIHAEVRALSGEPDPAGLGHRLAGVEGTIDGLLFPVQQWADEGARAWMYDVSMFVQVADDWLDLEADAAVERPTPVIDGVWGFAEVASTWQRTLDGVEDLVRAAGLGSHRYVRLVREAYQAMMLDVLEAMVARPNG